MTARNGKPIFKIDGPFGAASEDIFDYQYVMLIAAGALPSPRLDSPLFLPVLLLSSLTAL